MDGGKKRWNQIEWNVLSIRPKALWIEVEEKKRKDLMKTDELLWFWCYSCPHQCVVWIYHRRALWKWKFLFRTLNISRELCIRCRFCDINGVEYYSRFGFSFGYWSVVLWFCCIVDQTFVGSRFNGLIWTAFIVWFCWVNGKHKYENHILMRGVNVCGLGFFSVYCFC